MDCFGTCFTHVQTCDVTRVLSATEWTASVHTLHMSKPVMQLVFNVLGNGRANSVIMKYCRQWQWRFENASCLDLCKITAKMFRIRLDKKCDENAADTTAKRKTPQKTNPIFRAQKNMDMLQFHANNHVLVTFFFPAHCNCADFRDFFQIAMLQNHENFHVFQLFTTDVFQ